MAEDHGGRMLSPADVNGVKSRSEQVILDKIDEITVAMKSLSLQAKRIGRYQALALKWDQQHQRNIRNAAESINKIIDVLAHKTGTSSLQHIEIEEDPSLIAEPSNEHDFRSQKPVPAYISLHDLLLKYAHNGIYFAQVEERMKKITDHDFQTLDETSVEPALEIAFNWANEDCPDKSLRMSGLMWIKAVAARFPSLVYSRIYEVWLLKTRRCTRGNEQAKFSRPSTHRPNRTADVESELLKFPPSHEYAKFLRDWMAHVIR